jgi:hypothetical protein
MSALRPEADIRFMHRHSKKDVKKILVRIAMLFEVRTSPLSLEQFPLRPRIEDALEHDVDGFVLFLA